MARGGSGGGGSYPPAAMNDGPSRHPAWAVHNGVSEPASPPSRTRGTSTCPTGFEPPFTSPPSLPTLLQTPHASVRGLACTGCLGRVEHKPINAGAACAPRRGRARTCRRGRPLQPRPIPLASGTTHTHGSPTLHSFRVRGWKLPHARGSPGGVRPSCGAS